MNSKNQTIMMNFIYLSATTLYMRIIYFCLLLFLSSCSSQDEIHFIKIGSASQVGVYYSLGLSIAEFVNSNRKENQINAAVEATAGSIFNINAIESGALEFGFTQNDRLYHAVQKQHKESLRFICHFHPEFVSLIARDDTEIETVNDLRSHVVSIGPPGSGTRLNALEIIQEIIDDIYIEALSVTNASLMLQDGRIDAFFYTAGQPNGSLLEATNGMQPVHFVPITNQKHLIEKYPYYFKASIPIAFYPKASNTQDIETIATLTAFITSTDVPDAIVYNVTKAIFENIETLKSKHPAFQDLNPEKMIKNGFAPYHPGAFKYYREQKWL